MDPTPLGAVMPRRDHRKRAFLFLAAVLLPSAVLVGTTVRLIRQQRELAAQRAEEERSQLALEIGREILERLGSLGNQVGRTPRSARESSDPMISEPAIVRLGWVDDGRLIFRGPVEPDPVASADPVRFARYSTLMARGEEAEFRRKAFVEAARLYREAAETWEEGDGTDSAWPAEAEGPLETTRLLAEARVHEARALSRAHRTVEARSSYRLLAEAPPFLLDGESMPYCVYGLEGLVRTGGTTDAVLPLLKRTLPRPPFRSEAALLAWRDVAREILTGTGESPEEDLLQTVESAAARGIATLQGLDRLRADFPGILATVRGQGDSSTPTGSPAWVAYGENPWVVGVFPAGDGVPSRVVVADPALLLDPGQSKEEGETVVADSVDPSPERPGAAPGGVHFLPAGDPGGESLGPALRGLRASLPPDLPLPQDDGSVESWFFRLLLPVILLLTGFTAYLAWRDVRRETEAARLRSQFVSSVTHELKTPLTSIRMFAETLRLGRHASPEVRQEYLDTVVHETERLSRLINNVLDFARIDRGEKTYHLVPTDVSNAAREAKRAVAYPLAQGGYELATEIADDLPLVTADGDALTQALLNLLSNAIKFSGEGSRIDLRVFRDGNEILMQVEDRGRGIAPRDREGIFRDFFRASDAEAEGIPGTGLGLPLVAHVAEAHEGRVEVESEVGRGSTFTIRIPVESAPLDEGGTP